MKGRSATPTATIGGFEVDGERWRCSGEITFNSAAAVLAAAGELPLPAGGSIDCADIGAVDSAAVAVLVAIKRRAVAERRSVAFTNLSGPLLTLAELYDVASILRPAAREN